ncbi:MAG: YkgJ family cysteine cluster protein [Candidatus Binataceae bacterium]
MNSGSRFSYQCNACGRCCHDQVITLSPYDVIRLARAANVSTSDAIIRFTLRRGSLLRFDSKGACAALNGVRCSVHSGRPLACRLYPLGFQRSRSASSRLDAIASEGYLALEREGSHDFFTLLEPAAGSAGIYGTASTIAAFLESQEAAPYFCATERYYSLLEPMRARIVALIDFDRIEPREFWRRAFNEAMRESGYDPNPLIESIFDADTMAGAHRYDSEADLITAHIGAIANLIRGAIDAAMIAAAAILLAISLGYSTAEVTNSNQLF